MSSDSQYRQVPRESSMLIVPLIVPSMITHFVIRFVGSPHPSRTPSPAGQDTLTLRALVSTKDAGVIIGKGGKNVADLRDQTGVKAGVSKVTPGVHERVLTISGPVERVADVSLPFSSPAAAVLTPYVFFFRSFSPGLWSRGQPTSLRWSNTSTTWNTYELFHPPPDLSQPHGHSHRQEWKQNKIHPGRIGCSHGRFQGDASPIN